MSSARRPTEQSDTIPARLPTVIFFLYSSNDSNDISYAERVCVDRLDAAEKIGLVGDR
jgi:hypothetical protein